MLKIYKDVSIIINKTPSKATIEEYSRGGSKSPTLTIIIRNGIRYTPFACEKKNISIPLSSLFKMVYCEHINELIPNGNLLFSHIKTDKSWGNTFHQAVVFGTDDGIEF